MITFRQLHPEGSDGTAPYDVSFDRNYTVKDFVDYILNNELNWGSVTVGDKPRWVGGDLVGQYTHGKIRKDTEYNHKWDDCIIKSAHMHGGWSYYNYYLVI